jgi:hypothetical protein
MAYFLVVLLTAALITSATWKRPKPEPFHGLVSADVPTTMDGCTSEGDIELAPEVALALNSASYVSRVYGCGVNTIAVDLIAGTDRSALHDPRSCLIGDGWRLAEDRTEHLPGTNIDVRAMHAVGKSGSAGSDIVYFYIVNGRAINEVSDIRMAMLWSALLGRKNTPAYYFRFAQSLDANGTISPERHQRLLAFASKMWAGMQDKVAKVK